jgi:DMSO/TMAO reductase YedYZ heme-binding membrane subunit
MKKTGGLVYLVIIIIAAAAVALALQLLQPSAAPINWVIRIAALTGYFCIFGAIVTSAYLRQVVRWFGRPFIKIHHILSIVGLSLVTIHPLAVAWRALDLGVFVPAVNSWNAFFSLGGRPAWYLLGVGALAAVLRRAVGKRWKLLHFLNYLAFCLATVHGILIGANVQNWPMRVVFGAMALIVLGVFVRKRVPTRRARLTRPFSRGN